MLVTRKAVRGGMKGVRRSVKRGQSVEFTDYRDYSLGDDLRSLDWNIYARLEKLFIKLFIEEEDVTVHILVDASASMDGGTPDKLLFAKRAAAALAYVGLASYDRVSMAVLQGRVARRFPAVRGTGRVFQVLADLSRRAGRARADRPRRLRPPLRGAAHPARPAAADQRPVRRQRRAGDPRARRHALRRGHPAQVLEPRRAGPAARGRPATGRPRDRRRASTSPRTWPRSTPTARAWRPGRRRLEATATKRRVAYVPVPTTLPLADLVFAELRRRRRRGLRRRRWPFLAPLAIARPRLPAAHRRLLHAPPAPRRADGQQHLPVAAAGPRRRGQRAVAAAAPLAAAAAAAAARAAPRRWSSRARSGSARPVSRATWCWSSTRRPPCPPRTSSRIG